jgi:hypothetical protein
VLTALDTQSVSSFRLAGLGVMELADDGARELIISGTTPGVGGVQVRLVVVLEPVAADDVGSELIALHAAEVCADEHGRFVYRYELPEEVRARLTGWVMCSVMAQRMVAGAPIRTKVVRWQRQTSAELVSGLNALLGTINVDAGTGVRATK